MLLLSVLGLKLNHVSPLRFSLQLVSETNKKGDLLVSVSLPVYLSMRYYIRRVTELWRNRQFSFPKICLMSNIFIRPTKVGRIMLWRGPSVRPSVINIWLSTGVTTFRITLNFTNIIQLVHPIHDASDGYCSSLNICILNRLLMFAFWSFLTPLFKLEHSNLVLSEHLQSNWHKFRFFFYNCKILFFADYVTRFSS